LESDFAVLSPGGRDRTRIFAQGAGLPSDAGHPPVNYHAYAACCHGGFYRKSEEVPDAVRHVMVLLRKDGLGHALNAARELRRRGKRVLVSWKESGLTQVARILGEPRFHEKFKAVCAEVDGFISSTTELVPLYEAARCGRGGFVPTPYPLEEPAWDFSLPIPQRQGIFIGTREFGVFSRNHLLAISSVLKLGKPVTVINTEGWTGARLLRSISRDLRVISGKLPYTAYLCLVARHRIVFQLDRSAVPGQVAGDALLCRLPCVGGDGGVDKLAFPDLCGPSLSVDGAIQAAERLVADDKYYAETIEKSRELARKRLSFSTVKNQLHLQLAV
jgi:hypothetical protein